MARALLTVLMLATTAIVPQFAVKGSSKQPCDLNCTVPASIRIQYYEITAETAPAVQQQIFEKGPIDSFGMRRAALFSWRINWEWADAANKNVDLAKSKMTAEYELILPKLSNLSRLKHDFQKNWLEYMRALTKHELNHYLNADRCVGELGLEIERIKLVSPLADRSTVMQEMRKILKNCSRRDLQYDAATNHGVVEGVELTKAP